MNQSGTTGSDRPSSNGSQANGPVNHVFGRFSRWASRTTGHPLAFLAALVVVLTWGVTGPIFGFSDTWQLVINTGTTIVTFLMVFLIQSSQNRDTEAMHLKLDELIRAVRGADNALIDLEGDGPQDLQALKSRYERLAMRAREVQEKAREIEDRSGRIRGSAGTIKEHTETMESQIPELERHTEEIQARSGEIQATAGEIQGHSDAIEDRAEEIQSGTEEDRQSPTPTGS